MKRYELTSDKIKGTIEVWYGFNDMLWRIDLQHAVLDYVQVFYLLKHISPDRHQLVATLAGSGLTIKELDYDITVEEWLSVYPYQRNTHLVRSYWPTLGKKERILAYFGAMDYAAYLKREDWCKPKIPDTWLRQKQYLNNWRML